MNMDFRSLARTIAETLADHVDRALDGAGPVLPAHDPDALAAAWADPFPATGEGPAAITELVDAVLTHSNRLHHPGYVGHQVAVPIPAAALVEASNALLNNGMAVYEMGQLQTVMERRVVEWMAGRLGWDADSKTGPAPDGVLTHGGSAGNLTALLAMRQAAAGHDVWTDGHREPLSILVSEEAHYCIDRAVRIMGWGARGAIPVRTDDRRRLDRAGLDAALSAARADGRRVIGVVASSCSTAIGSFDPIDIVADFCEEHGLRLHVDGAHGATWALSRRHRGRVAGIERADSVVWDLHKMMGLPTLSTAVLFRDGRQSSEAFAQEASYLFDGDGDGPPWWDIGHRTLECSKRSMSVTAYVMLRALGTDYFSEHVDRLADRTIEFAAMIRETADFEAAHDPDANILCFRHRPGGLAKGEALDEHQRRLRRTVVESGAFYLVQTGLDGETWLRVTIMNPATTREDLARLLDALRSAAPQITGA